MRDTIYRGDAIKAIEDMRCWLTLASQRGDMGRVLWDEYYIKFEDAIDALMLIPSVDRPQGEEMTNSEWKEFLAEQWGVSKACAKEMLHAMYAIKEKDSIKKGFDKRKGADNETE